MAVLQPAPRVYSCRYYRILWALQAGRR